MSHSWQKTNTESPLSVSVSVSVSVCFLAFFLPGVSLVSLQSREKPRGCAGCNGKIRDRFMLQALDRYWHEDCLKCACCDCRLGRLGSTLYTRANLILCRRDYLRYGSHMWNVSVFLREWYYDIKVKQVALTGNQVSTIANTSVNKLNLSKHHLTVFGCGVLERECFESPYFDSALQSCGKILVCFSLWKGLSCRVTGLTVTLSKHGLVLRFMGSRAQIRTSAVCSKLPQT